MERKTTSLKVNPELWKKFKIYCLQKDKELSEYVEEMISKEMKKG